MSNSIRCVLLDVEGTTSSIRFVYDEMFPFVRQSLDSFLAREWESESVRGALPMLADDLGRASVEEWIGAGDVESQRTAVSAAVIELMDDDVKATGLKELQGAIWKDGFESGALVAHLYPDVAEAMAGWVEDGLQVRIYSSGSIQAQRLFFGHTVAGDLLPLISGHYDTTSGPKKESASYVQIAEQIGLAPSEILFVSDVGAELDAASTAGMATVLSVRPGNLPVDGIDRFVVAESFSEIVVG